MPRHIFRWTGGGIEGKQSGLWKHMARIVGEVRPDFVWVENSPMLVVRGLGTVLADLSTLGYDCRWGVVGAHHAGANHQRDRIWIVGKMAYTKKLFSNGCNDYTKISLEQQTQPELGNSGWQENVAHADSAQCERRKISSRAESKNTNFGFSRWWEAEPNVVRVVDGMAARLDKSGTNFICGDSKVETVVPNRAKRLKAIGNGQVPAAMMIAWKTLTQDL